ncbi:hypothetical protein AALP_AAs51035U000100 [Arabis alpina]|uniref:Uncharacterized protein n=1 Tax=Arabis alpina TaxID=50452 RepID=A0A087FYA9_ARAAL|nr:hypothetical protein AALP_AAs51035U000100 [Arabis alpina]
MSSKSSTSVKLDRKKVRRDSDVTLAHTSDYRLDASIPTGVPLAGPLDRRLSDASSPEVELPEHQFEAVPPQRTGPSASRPTLKELTDDGSSYARSGSNSRGSDPSDRVETDEGTSGGKKGSLINFRTAAPKSPCPGLCHGIKLDDCNDVASSMRSSMVYVLTPARGWDGIAIRYPERNDRPWSPPKGFLCVYKCFIKNGGFCFPIPRLLLQYCHRRRIAVLQLTHGSIRAVMAVVVLAAERGGVVTIDEFEEISPFSPIGNTGRFYISPQGGYQLVAGHSSQDVLISKVGALTSALAEVDEAKKGEVSRIEGEVAELKSASKDAVARAVGEAKKRAKDKLRRSLEIMEARSRAQTEVNRLASLANQVPTRDLALDISSAESSEDEAEGTEVDGRTTVAGKIPALTRAEIEEAMNGDTQDGINRLEFQGEDVEDVIEPAGAEEPAVTTEPAVTETVNATTEAVDAATGEPIAPLFPDPTPEEQLGFFLV